MYSQSLTRAVPQGYGRPASETVEPRSLTGEDVADVLDFLGRRPVHNSGLLGFIADNGIVSPHNRGSFYGHRERGGRLTGVALIGHATLFESRSEAALAGFAMLARRAPGVHMVMGEYRQLETFWRHYNRAEGPAGPEPRLFCREMLLRQRWALPDAAPAPDLRLATAGDLDLVVPVHAQTAYAESGIDPLQVDPVGFRRRCSRRIEGGRTWVWTEGGRLIFKAEVVTDTPEVAYLEGIWVNPEERRKGVGLRCVSQLSRTLLARSRSICLFVNRKNRGAQAFYKRAGFKLVSLYDMIFLDQGGAANLN